MSDNKIELSGIFSEGYGINPKRLMRLKLDEKLGKGKGKWVKLVLSYMLSYTGGGTECFPAIKTIASDLEVSKDTVINAIKDAERLKMLEKSKLFPNDPLKHQNKYTLKFLMQDPNIESRQSRITLDGGTTFMVRTFEQNNNTSNNNKINNIYIHWNSFKIVTHSKITSKIKSSIQKKLREFSEDEIKTAIKNYSEILKSDKYFFSYKWSLWEFLNRGMENFLDDQCFEKYLSFQGNSSTSNQGAAADRALADFYKDVQEV